MRYAKYNIRNTKSGPRVTSHQLRMNAGSALILTVVLTSLLAIVGVLFVMMARVNQIASSGLSESKELDAAIETVIAKISDELVLDVPGVSATNPDYYDYPDVNNAWLASLEPYQSETDPNEYYWRQISDVTGFLADNSFPTQDVDVKPVGLSTTVYVRDYPEITLDSSGELEKQSADADGDGIADSKWVELADITSSRGRPIYAAIRIIDNGGMLNVNTAYKFDPNVGPANANLIDGSSQTQINLFALAQRSTSNTIGRLDNARYGDELRIMDDYIKDVVWRYDRPDGNYTPFDISDELELRNRLLVNHPDIDTRIEEVWNDAFMGAHDVKTPVRTGGAVNTNGWFDRAQYDVSEPNANEYYSYRHIGTTYNMDRIIDPNGEKMVNINRADANSIYRAIKSALDPNFADVNDVAAQIAVNLIDFRDNDSNVTTFLGDTTYYGFERPCVYISELAHKFVLDFATGATYRSYAIELYKPYPEDNDPCDWRLVIDGTTTIDINNWMGNEQFYVIRDQNSNALLDVNLGATVQDATFVFTANTEIRLERPLPGGGDVTVDWYEVDPCIPAPWLSEDNAPHSVHRDIQPHKCIRRLWAMDANSPTLGRHNNFVHPDANRMQAHPANKAFTNVGEIGMLLRKSAYSEGPNTIGPTDTEADVRLDLTKPEFQQVFNYLTVWPPSAYVTDPNEARIKGRININTAPWFVLAQLPWMQYTAVGDDYQRAQRIADNRGINGPYKNIGELMRVAEMRSLNLDGVANLNTDDPKGPDLTSDFAQDDFEERDLILTRISNLVTVRSDVFTAYILVRIGTDGPQKRVIAILDRSDVYSPTDRVKIVAVHPVADPR